jgi:hypothetical protein
MARPLIDPEDHLPLIVIDFHPLHQGADQLASAGPVCVLQPVFHLCGNVLESPDDQWQFDVQGRCIRELVGWLFACRDPLSQVGDPGLELALLKEPFGITVDQPCQALPPPAPLPLDRGEVMAPHVRVRVQSAAVFLRQALGRLHQRSDLAPYGEIQPGGPHLRRATDARAAQTRRIRPQAPVIGIIARPALGGRVADALAVIRLPPPWAADQALPQVCGAAAVWPRVALVVPQLLLDRRTHRGRDHRRHRERQPLLARPLHRRGGAPRLQGTAALGPQARARQALAGLAERGRPPRGGVPPHAPHDTAIPPGLAGARRCSCPAQAATHSAARDALVADPVEQLAHDPRFVRQALTAGLPATGVLGKVDPYGAATRTLTEPACAACRLPRRWRSRILARSSSASIPWTCSRHSSSGVCPHSRFRNITSTPARGNASTNST